MPHGTQDAGLDSEAPSKETLYLGERKSYEPKLIFEGFLGQ